MNEKNPIAVSSEIKNLWLKWAREIQSIAQTGLAFAPNHYEEERSKRLMEVASEILENYTNLTKEDTLKVFLKQPGYATPKIDVRSAVIKEGKILLVQEAQDKRWAMPGGWADVGDLPSEVAIRETKEESGFDIGLNKVIGVFDANRRGRPLEFFHAFKIIFLADLIGGEPRTSFETLAVEFFDFDNLPPLSKARTNEKHLKEIQEHLQDPTRRAYFD
jgi:ADP-ribose pyrophosphatase YjhB (NUDIX family)